MLVGGTALAAPPPAKPQGDDVGFLTFGVVAERTALAFYKKALTTPDLFDAADRRRLTQARDAKREHIQRLNAALGDGAVVRERLRGRLPQEHVRHPQQRRDARRRAREAARRGLRLRRGRIGRRGHSPAHRQAAVRRQPDPRH